MDAPSASNTFEMKTIPKPGPNSVILRRRSALEEQEQRMKTREAVKQYISKYFGDGLTESQKEFVAAANEVGKLSARLVIFGIFVLWYMIAMTLRSTLLLDNVFVVRCKIPAVEHCLNFTEVLDISLLNKTPTIKNPTSRQYCRYDDREYSELVATYSCQYKAILNSIKLNQHVPNTKPCADYVSQHEKLSTLLQSELPISVSLRDDLKLYCDKDVWNKIFLLSPKYGFALSSLLLVTAADRFGRKRMFIVQSIIHFVGAMLILVLPCKTCMAVGFVLTGFGSSAALVLYVLFLEQCSDKLVLHFGLLSVIEHPVNYLMEFMLHYTISTWLYIHLAVTSMLLILPFGIWYITESPRWLMFTGNGEAAWAVLRKVDSTVGPSSVGEGPQTEKPSQIKIFRFFYQPLFRDRLTACIVLCFLTSVSFYVLKEESMKDMRIGTGDFYIISTSFQVFVLLIAYLFAIRYGRRRASFIFYCSLTTFDALIFMENQLFDSKQILPLLLYCRDSIKEGIYHLVLYYICEIFPTPYRLTALNICVASICIGDILQEHFYHVFHPEPKAITYMPPFIASVTCALMVSFLPKTRNDGLPDIPRDALLFRIDN